MTSYKELLLYRIDSYNKHFNYILFLFFLLLLKVNELIDIIELKQKLHFLIRPSNVASRF